MKSGKRVGQLLGLAVVLVAFLVTVTGCMSLAVKMAQSMTKDYGVYDTSVPESQMSDFIFVGVNVRYFNDNQVNWGDKANNMGRIKVPAGVHDIVYDWIQEETQQTGSSHSSAGTTTTYTTTTRSLTGLKISQIEFLPGHKYALGGAWVDGAARIHMQDITNTPSEMWGDTVANAPKESKIPTNFEGTWKGEDSTVFKFAGNTWEMTIPPGVSTNFTDQESQSRGTFAINGDKMSMYLTHVGLGGKWVKVSALKQEMIWTHSLIGSNLEMEIEYYLPKVVYLKQ